MSRKLFPICKTTFLETAVYFTGKKCERLLGMVDQTLVPGLYNGVKQQLKY